MTEVPVVVCIPTTPERRLRLQKCVESLTRYAGYPFVLCTYENQYVGAIAAIHAILDRLDPDALVWWIGDDVVLSERDTLRKLVERFEEKFPDRDGVVNPNDEIQHGRIITAPLATARILKEGQSKEFFHNFADNLFTDIMVSRGKYEYVEDVHIQHHHWCNGKAPQDYTYTNANTRFEQDKQTYERLRATIA